MWGRRNNIISHSKLTAWRIRYKTICVLLLAFVVKSNAQSTNKNVPCRFFDSVNITNGVKNNDESITFEGITYPKKLYAFFDYEYLNESYRQPVASHLRGCICVVNPLKPCVRLCCPRGQYRFNGTCHENDTVYDMSVTYLDKMESLEANIFDAFNYVSGKPCLSMDMLEPETYREHDAWVLLRDGSILRGDPTTVTLSKEQYCFNSIYVNDTDFETVLMVCHNEYDDTREYLISFGMLISVPFLLVTTIVYVTLPELRNVHGLSLVCYLIGLIVAYTILSLLMLNGNDPIEATLCQTSGYIVYFSFMSAFLWLSVISFDLWRNFCCTQTRRKFNDLRRFLFYSIYAWGTTIAMALICFGIDSSSLIPDEMKPGFGIDNCFLGQLRWQQFIYLYLPIILIMSCNLTFFILTSMKIRNVQNEMARYNNSEESKVHRKNLDKEKAKWALFLRLFIVMGATWTMEAASWIFSDDGSFFYITDIMNATQGVAIFVLFVMRRKVKELIIKRWKVWKSKSSTKKGEKRTETTSTTNTTADKELELAAMN